MGQANEPYTSFVYADILERVEAIRGFFENCFDEARLIGDKSTWIEERQE